MIQSNYATRNYAPSRSSNSHARPAEKNSNGASQDSVVLGTYNIKNWFAPEDANQELGKKPKPQRELDNMFDNIQQSGAQIVTMQEVGTSLKNIKDQFASHLPSFKYFAMEETNDARGVHVIMASQFPITKVTSHTANRFALGDGTGETKFSRDLLRADFDVKGTPFTVFTTHGKSRRTYAPGDPAHPGGENPDNQRLGEGKEIGRIVREEMKSLPGQLYVVTGDLNDGTEDPSVQAVINGDGNGEKLFDTLEGLPEKARRTWPANPKAGHGHDAEQFDHILVPTSQRAKLKETHIVDIPGVSQAGSDHLELVATFNLRG